MMLLAIFIFLVLSALFSGAEIAFVSANKLKIEIRKKKHVGRGAILAEFYEKPAAFLSTMLVGNNIALVVFTTLMAKLMEPLIVHYIQGEGWILLTNTLIVTLIILVFGEFLPKTLFRLFADDILFGLAYPLKGLVTLLRAPAWVMTRLSMGLLRLFWSIPSEDSEQVLTRLDLENLINESGAENQEVIDRELLGKALNLKDIRVRECMIPRPEIETVEIDAAIADLEQRFQDTRLSRLLVVEGDIDNLHGYVHHQQLLQNPPSIRELILPITFIPGVLRITDLLNKFIKERINIACVVDEFGGVTGLITLEDILEELFGEIEDEYDQEDYIEQVIEPGVEYLFSGRLEIDYLNEKFPEIELPDGDYHTLSGYIVTAAQTIPEQGVELVYDGFRFVLENVSETKIELVRVFKLPPAAEEGS
ncbi:MAG: HlyC/CorC family transporter [Lewinellaceae bacterium]|nr:HlyC/CorC family transporter [Lewinellaceae bacterium]